VKIVITHHNADLDALASTIAAARLFDAVPVMGNIVAPPVKKFLALHKDYYGLTPVGDLDEQAIEAVFVVDVRDARRLRDFDSILTRRPYTHIIDHHPAGPEDIEADVLQVEPVGACVTLLVEHLLAQGMSISPAEATLYLLGLYSDTGRLSFSSTQPRDVRIAAQLLEVGANLRVVNRFLRRQYSEEQSQLLVDCMASITEESVHSVEVAFATARAERFVHGASSVVQQVLEFGGHDAIFGVIEFERNRRVQIIGRSRVSYIDMGQILSRFGGGGHRGAAAASVKGREIEDIVQELKDILCNTPPEPTRVREIMVSPVLTLDHSDTLEYAKGLLESQNVSGAPILRDGEICGVLSKRDVTRAQKADKLHLPVSSHMTHHVVTIAPEEPVEDAFSLMIAHDVGRLPVVKHGQIMGIISRSDLIRTLYMKHADDSDIVDGF
jgi:tRNA nucleotidyltransferase (CCA-adding enzyme)